MIDIRNAELLGIGEGRLVSLHIGVGLTEYENILEVRESAEEQALSLEVVEILIGDGLTIGLAFEVIDHIVGHCHGVVAICPHCGVGSVGCVLPVVTSSAASGVLEGLLHTVAGTHLVFNDTVAGVPTGGAQVVVSAKGGGVEAIVGSQLDFSRLLELGSLLEEIFSTTCKTYKRYGCEYI